MSGSPATALGEDADWDGFITPGLAFDSGIQPAEYHGKLVLYGDIQAAAGQSARGVVLWDGSQFEPLPPIGVVTALTIWNDHIVAAAGTYSSMAIASFDGVKWDTLGTTSGTVHAMTVFNGNLVVVGAFLTINSQTVNDVASFDGTTWTGFGIGIPPPSYIDCAAVHAGSLVVGGQFPSLGNVASWNPVTGTWQMLGSGLSSGGLPVFALASDGVNLFSGNYRWDGTSWYSLGLPFVATRVTMWNGQPVMAAPINLPASLSTWNGVALAGLPGDSVGFHAKDLDNGNTINGLATWGTKLVVTGRFYANGVQSAPGIITFDGSHWATVYEAWQPGMKGPLGLPILDMRVWAGKLVICGPFGLVADGDHFDQFSSIVAWDGQQWSGFGPGLRVPNDIACLGEYQGDLVVAGWETRVGYQNPPSMQYVVRWNGSNWSQIGAGAAPPFGPGPPTDANSIQQFRTDLYVGSYDLCNLCRWNGSTWSLIPGLDNWPLALGTTTDSLVIGGLFTSVPSPNVVFWDGTNWLPAGAGVNSYVYTIANWGGRVVIGGSFTASGATPLPGAAVWDGAAWQPLGDNVVDVDRMQVINGELYAFGGFRLPDGTVIATLARYIGPHWEILGSGSNNFVFAAYRDSLYQAGTGLVHGQLAHSLAVRATPAPVLSVPREGANTLALSASPNPSGRSTVLSVTMPTAGPAQLEVLDVSGRVVAKVWSGILATGRHSLTWRHDLAAGIYFVDLRVGSAKRVRRVVLVH
jgi:hypothetical protein